MVGEVVFLLFHLCYTLFYFIGFMDENAVSPLSVVIIISTFCGFLSVVASIRESLILPFYLPTLYAIVKMPQWMPFYLELSIIVFFLFYTVILYRIAPQLREEYRLYKSLPIKKEQIIA